MQTKRNIASIILQAIVIALTIAVAFQGEAVAQRESTESLHAPIERGTPSRRNETTDLQVDTALGGGPTLYAPDGQYNVIEVHIQENSFWALVNGQYMQEPGWQIHPEIPLVRIVLGDQGNDLRIFGFSSKSVNVQVTDGDGDDFARNYTSEVLYYDGRQGAGDDEIIGGSNHDLIFGGHGNDVIMGGGGDDRLLGGFGADAIFGEEGDDEIHGCGVLFPSGTVYGGGPPTHSDYLTDFLSGGAGSDHFEDARYLTYSITQEYWGYTDQDTMLDFNESQDTWSTAYAYTWY